MADKYYDMGAMQAFYDKIKTLFQTVANKVTSWSSTPSDDKYPSEKLVKTALNGCRTIPQDISKGANLVVNGSGTMMTNYNFNTCDFIADTDLPTGVAGCFHKAGLTFFNNEHIAVNTSKAYRLESWYRVKSASTSTVRLTLACFDIDGKEIQANTICFGVGTTTQLTQDLKNGDTVVHLADLSASGWTNTSEAWQRGFIFWNYKNSFGYQYPPETYSRNTYGTLFETSNVNVSAGTITLNTAWNKGTIPAGTYVSRYSSGGTYTYVAYTSNAGALTTWTKLSGIAKGSPTPGYTDGGAFRPGTAFIKVGWCNANTSGNEWIEFGGIELREIPETTDKLTTARQLAVSLSNISTNTSFDGSANVTNIKTTGTLGIGNGGTGATTAIGAEYNILNQVADIDTTLNDDRKIALCNQTKSASNGVFRWIKLSNVWTWIKGKLSSDSGVNISGNAATASAAATGSALETAINGKEDKSNIVTAWQATPDDTHYPSEKLVKDSLDAYNDIGGRNLLSNSNMGHGSHFTIVRNSESYKGATFTHDGANADSYLQLSFLESIATGETITVSFDISNLNESGNEYIVFLLGILTGNTTYTVNKNGHTSLVITRTSTDTIVPGTLYAMFDDGNRFGNTAPSGFTISNIKIERGRVSTSYTKHPAEDPKGVYYVTGSSDYVAYSASSTYTATTTSGPFTSENSCTYGGKAYFCKTAITTPEAWTSAHWTAIATPVLTGTIDGLTSLYAGLKIAYKMSITGGSSSTYLNINNLGNKYIRRNDSNLTTHLPANTVVFLAYDGTYWRWADYDYAPNNWVTTMGAYCETAAATQAKTATSTNTVYTAGEAFLIRIVNANTYNGKITLNINGQGAKDVWINDAISSSSNKTLPAGEHWCYYDGSVFHIWTDGTAQFKKVKAESFIGDLSGTATIAAGYTNDGAIATAINSKQDTITYMTPEQETAIITELGDL